MNIGGLVPPPNIRINRPVKISSRGNLYKIQINHKNADDTVKKFEVWTTKEAVQQHYGNMEQTPKEYELKRFARKMYEKQMIGTGGRMDHQGVLVTTDSVTRGNPNLWPYTISHPEVKV